MIHEVQFKIDSDQLTGYTDEYLATLWHIAQANPAEDSDRTAGQLAERIGREIISRFIKAAPIPLWNHQGSDFYFKELSAARASVAEYLAAEIARADVDFAKVGTPAAFATGGAVPAGAGYPTELHQTGGCAIPGADLLRRAAEAVGAAAQPAPAEARSEFDEHFVLIPETSLQRDDGSWLVVPAFWYARYPASKGGAGQVVHDIGAKPWTNINFTDAASTCEAAGLQLARETQELVVRHLICQHPDNWTSGSVGEGSVHQGLHLGSVTCAQAASYPAASNERNWHVLPGGEKVYGVAGNIYTYVHDDVQGDERGLVKTSLPADSISLTTAPRPSMENGMGYRPDGARSWSGYALIRGGCWSDRGNAGVFALDDADPGDAVDRVGFRCTKPISGL
jgi:hypothetical protein